MSPDVIVAGAGISMAAPSNLPSWWQYNKKLIDVIKEQATSLCPEASGLMELIDVEGNLPVQCISDLIVKQGAGKSYFPLLGMLNSAMPNANHFALAELAKSGRLKAVVTTNFDTLIETAFREMAVPLMTVVRENIYYEAVKSSTCQLFKIHGSALDFDTLIDTVTQKAVGLSPVKRIILEHVLAGSEIAVLGFSGADLDFDLDYIPIIAALENGAKIIWVIRPGTEPNYNVELLMKKYPKCVQVRKMELSAFFDSCGVDYAEAEKYARKREQRIAQNMDPEVMETMMVEQIRKVFRMPHIGEHGCMGYCISLLNQMGLEHKASELADIYEKKFRSDAVDIFSVTGLNVLALQKMKNGKFEESIRYYHWMIECMLQMKKLREQAIKEGRISREDPTNRESDLEILRNMTTAYLNIGLSYFFSRDLKHAGVYLRQAREMAERAGDENTLGLSLFHLAKLDYQKDKDCDRYLVSLQKSVEYQKRSGNLDKLVEILLEECSVRMQIGEYDLVQDILERCQGYIKNVGDKVLDIQLLLQKAQYQLRKGQKEESQHFFKEAVSCVIKIRHKKMAGILWNYAADMYGYDTELLDQMEMLCGICQADLEEMKKVLSENYIHVLAEQNPLPVFIRKTLPDDKWRRMVIASEYLQEREMLPQLFFELCISYMKKGDWVRLADVAKCYAGVAVTEKDCSVARYQQGCAAMEMKDFPKAQKCFDEVLHLGSHANPLHLGWAQVELAVLAVSRGDLESATKHYRNGICCLRKQGEYEELILAGITYAKALFERNNLEEAMDCCDSLRTETDNTKLTELIQDMQYQLKIASGKKKTYDNLNVQAVSPQEIGNAALYFYEIGKKDYAWQLINLAKDRYQKIGDRSGIGCCENNMANFCRMEGRLTDAVRHYENARNIKEKEKDTDGVIAQLCNILSLNLMDLSVNVDRFADYAKFHLPEYKTSVERYRLYYSLSLYNLNQLHYAESLQFAKLACEGVEYLVQINEKALSIMKEIICMLEDLFAKKTENKSDNVFEVKISQAIQFYQTGQFAECCRMLDQMKQETGNDYKRLGQIYGTFGNAYLHQKQYQRAIECFMDAEKYFSNVCPKEKQMVQKYYFTAENGIILALDGLGRLEEAISIARSQLSSENLDEINKFQLSISLCNRILRKKQNELTQKQSSFSEILNMLNDLNDHLILGHEEKGVLYSAYGALYWATKDGSQAEMYYQMAKKEFLITNSAHLEGIEQVLKIIQECTLP